MWPHGMVGGVGGGRDGPMLVGEVKGVSHRPEDPACIHLSSEGRTSRSQAHI